MLLDSEVFGLLKDKLRKRLESVMAGETKLFEGTNMWFDLPTSDSSGAKDFYGALFGWEWLDVPMGDDMMYSMAMMGEKHIAAIFPDHGVQRKPGSPMMWMHHFWSYDVHSAVKRAEVLGGEVLMPPQELPGAGIKAVVTTPEGASFVLWQSDVIFGTDHFGELNATCWTEYYTRDAEQSYRFFEEVLSIKFKKEVLTQVFDPSLKYEYHSMIIGDGSEDRGGMLSMDEQWGDMQSHFMLYFRVDDCEAYANRAGELGGVVCVPPTDIPPGKFSVLSDPQGGTFSILQMNSGK